MKRHFILLLLTLLSVLLKAQTDAPISISFSATFKNNTQNPFFTESSSLFFQSTLMEELGKNFIIHKENTTEYYLFQGKILENYEIIDTQQRDSLLSAKLPIAAFLISGSFNNEGIIIEVTKRPIKESFTLTIDWNLNGIIKNKNRRQQVIKDLAKKVHKTLYPAIAKSINPTHTIFLINRFTNASIQVNDFYFDQKRKIKLSLREKEKLYIKATINQEEFSIKDFEFPNRPVALYYLDFQNQVLSLERAAYYTQLTIGLHQINDSWSPTINLNLMHRLNDHFSFGIHTEFFSFKHKNVLSLPEENSSIIIEDHYSKFGGGFAAVYEHYYPNVGVILAIGSDCTIFPNFNYNAKVGLSLEKISPFLFLHAGYRTFNTLVNEFTFNPFGPAIEAEKKVQLSGFYSEISYQFIF